MEYSILKTPFAQSPLVLLQFVWPHSMVVLYITRRRVEWAQKEEEKATKRKIALRGRLHRDREPNQSEHGKLA